MQAHGLYPLFKAVVFEVNFTFIFGLMFLPNGQLLGTNDDISYERVGLFPCREILLETFKLGSCGPIRESCFHACHFGKDASERCFNFSGFHRPFLT